MPGTKRAAVYISSDASSSEPEDSPPAKRVTLETRSSRVTQQPARKQHETQDDNDESQTANRAEQKLQSIKSNLAASKAREKAFRALVKQIHRDQDELRAQLHKLAVDRDDDKALQQKLKQLVQDQVPELNPEVLELHNYLQEHGNESMSPVQRTLFDKLNKGPSFHTLQNSAVEVLSASNNLLATYQELNRSRSQQLNAEIKRLRAQWAQDKVETEKLLGVGRQVAQHRLEKMMPKSMRVVSTSSATFQPNGSDEEVQRIDRQLQQTLMRARRGVYHLVWDLPKR